VLKRTLKVWMGIGTYALANVGALALTVTEVSSAEPPSLSDVPLALSEQGSSCRAVAITGGGEGGEGEAIPTGAIEDGEGGEGEAIPTGAIEGGEGGVCNGTCQCKSRLRASV